MYIGIRLQTLILAAVLICVVLLTPCYIFLWVTYGKRSARPIRRSPPAGGDAVTDAVYGKDLGRNSFFQHASQPRPTGGGQPPAATVTAASVDSVVERSDANVLHAIHDTSRPSFSNSFGGSSSATAAVIYSPEHFTPTAPPLYWAGTFLTPFVYHNPAGRASQQDHVGPPPPSYNDVITTWKEPVHEQRCKTACGDRFHISGRNDLEWYQVFNAFNEKRMGIATGWEPAPPQPRRALKQRLARIDGFVHAQSHPVSERVMCEFLKSFNTLTNLVYAQSSARRIHACETAAQFPGGTCEDDGDSSTWYSTDRDVFLKSFHVLVKEYMPQKAITNQSVPFGYDWFVLTGRITYAVINAHITLCTLDAEDTAASTRPYYTENAQVDTRTVANGLKNICTSFTESLGCVRYGSHRVYVSTAFLYGSLLERACDSIVRGGSAAAAASAVGPGGVMPDYIETLNEILFDPNNRFHGFEDLINEIGKCDVPPVDDADTSVTAGHNEQTPVTFDGVYGDRTFIANRRSRMYSCIHSYCEQLLSVQLLLRENYMNEERLAALLSAVEPMSEPGSLFYFNLHSSKGAFKYRTGSALFSTLGISRFSAGHTGYGRVYVADRASILFVQSPAFTFHSIGQLSDLAFGDVQTADRDLMPAWLMGQRPLFRSENDRLTDIPCGAHLEPCVIDTGKSRDLLQSEPNTTDYTPTEAYSAVAAFEEQNIGAVFTCVRQTSMDVNYSRCTVATPYYTFTTYFRIRRNNDSTGHGGVKPIRVSCYTGSVVEQRANAAAAPGCHRALQDGQDEAPVNTADIVLRQTLDFDFKHCTVKVFVHARDGTDYSGDSVAVYQKEGVEKRPNSKSRYTPDELKNVSLSLTPYGGGGVGDSDRTSQSLGSVTILYRPKHNEIAAPVPPSLASRKITPRVTVEEDDNVYRVQVDARYVLYCDTVRNVLVLLDVVERRACIAPVRSTVRDFIAVCPASDSVNLMIESASETVRADVPGKMNYEAVCNNRIYTYF